MLSCRWLCRDLLSSCGPTLSDDPTTNNPRFYSPLTRQERAELQRLHVNADGLRQELGNQCLLRTLRPDGPLPLAPGVGEH